MEAADLDLRFLGKEAAQPEDEVEVRLQFRALAAFVDGVLPDGRIKPAAMQRLADTMNTVIAGL